ncbi:MAG: YihY/virulence factor BrkB family protein [Anaerolineae bacterium]
MIPLLPPRLNERLEQSLLALNRATDDLPHYLVRAVTGFFSIGMRNAAALSYYAVFSILPLILLLIVVLSRIVGPVITQEQIMSALTPFLPEGVSGALVLVQDFVKGALEQSGSITLIALVALAWSGLGLFTNIASALDTIFQAEDSFNLVKNRLRALGMAVVLILLLILSFFTSFVIGVIDSLLLDPSSVWLRISALALPLGLDMLIFTLLFRYVPTRKPAWEAIWPAALIGAAMWEIAKSLFGSMVSSSTLFQPLYGAIASGMMLLLWAYVLAATFLFAAELCAQINLWLHERHWQSDSTAILEDQQALPASTNQPPSERPRG